MINTPPIILEDDDKEKVAIPPADSIAVINDTKPETLEVGSDVSPIEVEKILREGQQNLVNGATDAMGAILSQFIAKPLALYDAAGKAVYQTFAGTNDERSKSFVDNYMSIQSKITARKGAYKWLNYEPVTDVGASIMGYVNKPLEMLSSATRFVGEHLADGIGAGLDVLEKQIRESGAKKPGGWTAEDEIALAGISTASHATLQTFARIVPDAALLALPAAATVGRRAALADTTAAAERLYAGLQKQKVPYINLRQLENFNDKPVTPVEAESIRAQIDAGQFSTDISIETVGGKPVRILTGADTVRSLQLAEQTQGVRIRDVKVRYVEKAQYSAQELKQLDALGKLGFAELLVNQKLLQKAGEAQRLSFKETIVKYGLDASGNLKRELLKRAGADGEAAVQALTLTAGGTPRASLLFGDMKKLVWGKRGKDDPALGFSKNYTTKWNPEQKYSERELFDFFAHANRAQEIARTKPGRVKTQTMVTPEGTVIETSKFVGYRLDGPITPSSAPGILNEVRRLVGDKRYAQFEERLGHLYESMHLELDRMRAAGLIDEVAYKKMAGMNYLTRRFSATLDNINLSDTRLIAVGDSGIPFLKHGTKDKAFITDVEAITAEHIARVERRIARNNATRALAKVAQAGTIDWVKPFEGKNVPVGYSEVKYVENGKTKSVIMQDKMAAEWSYGDPGMNYALAEILRVASGSTVIKALATGYNPEFALRNFARDIQHSWRATGTEYSSFGPLYLGQMAVNLKHVWKDALLKKGVYRDYVMDGGGFETLTHQGRNLSRSLDETGNAPDILAAMGYNKTAFAEKFNKVKENLAIVGEFSELVTRLAIRDRVLMNQKAAGLPADPATATYIARNYLDFSQGGTLTKNLDVTIPYLNANVQAIRTGLRPYTQGSKMAATTAFKDLQLLGTKAYLQSRYWNGTTEERETMRMVSDDNLISNFVFPLGMHIVDDDGVVKPLVLFFPLDSSVIPVSGPMDLLLKKEATGENPSSSLLTLLQAANPIGVTPMIPTVQAFFGYASNYNFYTNDQIWKGDQVLPGYEYKENTPEFYKLMGQLAPNSISPERLRFMVRTLAPSNPYIYGGEFVSNMMLEEQDPVAAQQELDNEKYQMTEELLTKSPGLRMMVKILEPAEAMSQIEKQTLMQLNTEMKVFKDDVNKVLESATTFGLNDPRGKKPYNDLMKKVAANYADRPDIQELATKTFMTKVATEVAWDRVVGKREMYFPTKDTWIQLSMRQPEERAKIFYNLWRNKQTDAERKEMFKIAATIDAVAGKGTILSDRFMIAFQKRKAKLGEEYPLVLDGK